MIHLIIKNRDQILFDSDVENITSYNKKGTFDILLDHANFISVLDKQIIVKQRGSTRQFTVDNGLVKVRENKVWIYLGIK